MKFTIYDLRFTITKPRVPKRALFQDAARCVQIVNRKSSIVNERAFTMIEIALCLAIISFALIAIIGVLPLGMNAQRDNREETVINQDATVLLEAIRSGARGADYLTNYIYAITNTASGTGNSWGYDSSYLTNGARIIGLLSTPEFEQGGQAASSSLGGISNHVVAYVRSISGLAAEKPPQDNSIMVGDTFAYRVYCVNAPMAVDANSFNPNDHSFAAQLAANQRELRLTFLWPQLPNGKVGSGKQTFRTTVAGQLTSTNAVSPRLYYYQSQSFTNAP